MPQVTERSRESVREMPMQTRAAAITAATLDAEARTVEVVWTTGAAVRRFDWWREVAYDEVLSLDPAHVRMARLTSGRAPVLDTHWRYGTKNVLGVVERAWLEGDVGRATLRFSSSVEAEEVFAKIREGVLGNVSVGYSVFRVQREEVAGGVEIRRVIDWEPHEISIVPVGADPEAHVRSAAPTSPCIFIGPEPISEEESMPDSTATRGATAPDAAANPPAPPVNETAVRAEAIKAEKARQSEIRRLCRSLKIVEARADTIIEETDTLEAARAKILDIAAAASEENSQSPQVRVLADEGDKVRSAVRTALAHRVDPSVTLDDHARTYRGMSLLELGRAYHEDQGIRLRGLNRMELAGVLVGLTRAAGMMSTSDFPELLANTAAKRLRAAYDVAPQHWKRFTRRNTLPDFKQTAILQLSSGPTFKKVEEGAEYTYGALGEGAEKYALATYGRIVAITRQTIINDDLSAFDRIPRLMGRQVAELEASIVWGIITANPNMADGVALFHATHGNLASAASAIDVPNLSLARAAMRKQKGLAAPKETAEPLNLSPKFLIVSPDKETEAQQVVAQIVPAEAGKVNPFTGTLEVIAEARLTGNAWYLAADPDLIDTIEYAYLEGEEGVYTETRQGFEVDGIEVKGRLDFAAKAIDHRGLYKNAGA